MNQRSNDERLIINEYELNGLSPLHRTSEERAVAGVHTMAPLSAGAIRPVCVSISRCQV